MNGPESPASHVPVVYGQSMEPNLNEPYLAQITDGESRSWTAPPTQIFAMGDNRSNSKDSRYFGAVSLDAIIGHAFFRFWPLNQLGRLP